MVVEFERSVLRLVLAGLGLGLCLFLTWWKRMLSMLESEFEFLLLLNGLVLLEVVL
jgi:hypothetical protein